MTTPAHVTIREVALRDGLQIESPIPLSAKLDMLAAIAATGVREVEATAFVSPSKVPALADAPELAAALSDYPEIEFSALVASPNGVHRAIAAGFRSVEYVVSAADGHSQANVGRSSAEAAAQITDIVAIAHDAGVSVEVIISTSWDCPFDGPTPPQRVLDTVSAGVTRLDSSIGGLGGCPFAPGASGNIATEDLVYLLRDSGVSVDIDLEPAIEAARVARTAIGHDLPSALLRAGDRIRG